MKYFSHGQSLSIQNGWNFVQATMMIELKQQNPHCNQDAIFSLIPSLSAVLLQSTSESHSVPANVQKVLSMMKSHNTKLCSSPGCTVGRTHSSGSSSGVSSAGSDLSELLLQLRDEFGHLSLWVILLYGRNDPIWWSFETWWVFHCT